MSEGKIFLCFTSTVVPLSTRLNPSRNLVNGTVLVFLPGEREIMEMKRCLKSDEKEAVERGWDILILHSKIPLEQTR